MESEEFHLFGVDKLVVDLQAPAVGKSFVVTRSSLNKFFSSSIMLVSLRRIIRG